MMEVKRAVDEVKDSLTLKRILGCLLATGNFLNGKTVSNMIVCVRMFVCMYVCNMFVCLCTCMYA